MGFDRQTALQTWGEADMDRPVAKAEAVRRFLSE